MSQRHSGVQGVYLAGRSGDRNQHVPGTLAIVASTAGHLRLGVIPPATSGAFEADDPPGAATQILDVTANGRVAILGAENRHRNTAAPM